MKTTETLQGPYSNPSGLPRTCSRARSCAFAVAGLLPFLALAPGCWHPRPPEMVTAEVIAAPVPGPRIVATTSDPFYEPLSPYGGWIVTSTCGRVWRPDVAIVGVGFEPYMTGGEWVYTDYGWSFETDWDFGWAVYHYGRWCPDPAAGWVWAPGYAWAPAWVEWRMGGGFIGWAPLLVFGMVVVESHFIFVEEHHFHHGDWHDHHHGHGDAHLERYRVPPEERHHAFVQSQPVHDTVSHGSSRWPRGPDPREVGSLMGAPLKPLHVEPPARGRVERVDLSAGRPGVRRLPETKPPEVVRPPEPKKQPPAVKSREPRKPPPVVRPRSAPRTPVTPPVRRPPRVRAPM